MCIAFISYRSHPDYPLILISNRDEFYDRPTGAAQFSDEQPDLLAGKDLVKGGTWLGIARTGRFGMVTNFRNPILHRDGARSRGMLTRDVILSKKPVPEFLQEIQPIREEFNPFSLLAGDLSDPHYYSNQEDVIRELNPGVYALSNNLLDVPWPKVVRGKKRFAECLSENPPNFDSLFELMQDDSPASMEELPSTGISKERERLVSSIFIRSPEYGTVSTTLLTIDNSSHVNFIEKSFDRGNEAQTLEFEFNVT